MVRSARRFAVVAGSFAALLCAVAPAAAPAKAALTTTAASAATAEPAGWVADGYGPGNTGHNPTETEITPGTVASLRHRWSIVSPVVRDSCARQAPPVVAGGRLFLSDQGGIAAYDATTGAQLWTYRFGAAYDEETPRLTVAGDRLFASFNSCVSVSDPDGRLTAFDAATGDQVWTVRRDAPMFVKVVDRGVVVVSGQDVGTALVTAYGVGDGAELWSREGLLPRPVSAGGRLLLTRFDAAGADLVDIGTGEALWGSARTWAVLAADPTGELLYAAGPAAELLAVRAQTGAVVWTVPDAAGQLSVDGSRLYVTRGTELVSRDADTGAQLWAKPASAQYGKPVTAGGVLYATVSGVRVNVLDPATGGFLDADATFEQAVGHPVIVNGWLYVTTGRVLDAYRL
jgi:outer membrane protein assembly factor BamB